MLFNKCCVSILLLVAHSGVFMVWLFVFCGAVLSLAVAFKPFSS